MQNNIGIVGTGYYVPDKIMTNKDLEKNLNTSDEWIYIKVGIKERRIAHGDQATSDLATSAAKNALKNTNIDIEEIDLIIVATSTPDMIQPPTASIIQGNLGAVNAAAFDVSAVCAGFAYAINVGVGMMKGFDNYKNVLVIGAETYSRILDWEDRTTCVFFGDGAGAVILSSVPEGYGHLSSYLMTDGKAHDVIKFPAGGSRYPATNDTIKNNMHAFKMDGKKVWDFAINAFPQAIEKVVDDSKYNLNDIDYVISHQANINIIKKSMDTLGLPMDKTYTNIKKYGNTSGASIPLALAEADSKNLFNDGELIALVGFGGGLSWGSALFKWYSPEGR